jgi:hypothetical protein
MAIALVPGIIFFSPFFYHAILHQGFHSANNDNITQSIAIQTALSQIMVTLVIISLDIHTFQ